MNINKKISVIIPVYNTERYLARCLDSIVGQSYSNLEIIIVDDYSPDNSINIITTYMKRDSRIQLIRNQTNRGLVATRMVGIEAATGDYLVHIDSDDFLSPDLFRMYMVEAERCDADIIITRHVVYDEETRAYTFLPDNNPRVDLDLQGQEVLDAFYNQRGQYFYWHSLCNKIYKRTVYESAMPHFQHTDQQINMHEDTLCSSVLFFYAQRVTSVDIDGMFYTQRTDALTTQTQIASTVKKNISDVAYVFQAIETFLREKHIYARYANSLQEWKASYWKSWSLTILQCGLKRTVSTQLAQDLGLTESDRKHAPDFKIDGKYASVPWDNRLETLRQLILSDKFTHISFDIFDTLVVRPLYEPSDLFLLMEELFSSALNSNSHHDFKSMRQDAELIARRECASGDEVTIDDIYECLGRICNIDDNALHVLKHKEKELEIQLCRQRKTAHQLYRLALSIGKSVIIVSDMYLDRDTITTILHKNGYGQYHKLYISSETKKTKASGKMYSHITKDLRILPQKILHIGDNQESNVRMAKRKRFNSFFMPTCIERLREVYSNIDAYSTPSDRIINYSYANSFLMTRCMLGIIAHHIFDNGYRSFHPDSDFNGAPEIIGYFPLGMHLLSTCMWLAREASQKKLHTIHFLSRDGWTYKTVYDLLARYDSALPRSNYLHVSRDALMPITSTMKPDLRIVKKFFLSHIHAYTPERMAQVVLKHTLTDAERALITHKTHIALNKPFVDIHDFHAFVDICRTHRIGEQDAHNAVELIRQYCAQYIGKDDACFDIGYSATVFQLLAHIGYPLHGYYIHSIHEKPHSIMRMQNKELETLYSYTPTITAGIFETFVSKVEAQCIGYRKAEDAVIPIFEDDIQSHDGCVFLRTMHAAAYRFAEDFLEIFSDYVPIMFLRNGEGSIVLQKFLTYPKKADMRMFEYILFQDATSEINRPTSVKKIWTRQLAHHNIENFHETREQYVLGVSRRFIHIDISTTSRFMRWLLYVFFDRDKIKHVLRIRTKARLSGHPFLYKTATRIIRSRRRRKKRKAELQ